MTVEKALAAIESPEFGEGKSDVVIATPDVTVVSDEKGMNENNMTESEAILPDLQERLKFNSTRYKVMICQQSQFQK